MGASFESIEFGSSGIRGPVGTVVTPELALGLGRAAAELGERILVGRDPRTSGPALEAAFVAGALSRGADVGLAGMVPTPTIGFGARGYDLGVVITASHNPPQDNGFKFWEPSGAALAGKGRERLLHALREGVQQARWDAVGLARSDPSAPRDHATALLDAVRPIEGDPRVVLDCGGGAGCALSPRLLREAGTSLLTLNADPDGSFAGRPSEPTPENLSDLASLVPATRALLGLAHDGDADRLVAVDERGRVVSGDALLVLLARELGARRLTVPVDTSRLVWDALPDANITVTRVGDAFVSDSLANAGGDFGGEPCGAYIFPRTSLCPDGLHAALVVTRIAAEHGGLAKLVDELPSYETRRTSIPHARGAAKGILERATASLEALGPTRRLDGVRVDTDTGWALVRPSGTEPKVRVMVEAREAADADALLERVLGIVRRSAEEASSHA